MSRDPRYQKLLNDRRWREVKRIVWQRTKGLCQDCLAEGINTPGVDVHHIIPVETAKSIQEMERLTYTLSNCRLLCIPCHIKTHQAMHTHTKEKVAENKERRHQRFMERNDPNYEPPTD